MYEIYFFFHEIMHENLPKNLFHSISSTLDNYPNDVGHMWPKPYWIELKKQHMTEQCWYLEGFEKYRVSTGFDPIAKDSGLIKGTPVVFRNNRNPSPYILKESVGGGVQYTLHPPHRTQYSRCDAPCTVILQWFSLFIVMLHINFFHTGILMKIHMNVRIIKSIVFFLARKTGTEKERDRCMGRGRDGGRQSFFLFIYLLSLP